MKYFEVEISSNIQRSAVPVNVNVVTMLLYHDYQTCWNNLATSLIISTRFLQNVDSLFHTCRQPGASTVDRLATSCETLACVIPLMFLITPCKCFISLSLTSSLLWFSCFRILIFSSSELHDNI